MTRKLTELLLTTYIKRKLIQYDIRMVHFIPGRIRLQSLRWKTNAALLEKIVKELQVQPMIFSVHPTLITGGLLILYDASYISSLQERDSWFHVLDKVYNAEYKQ